MDSGNYLRLSTGVHFWGHFREKNYDLASDFQKPLLPQRFETGSNMAPGRFLEVLPDDAVADLLDRVTVWPDGRVEVLLKFLDELPALSGAAGRTEAAQ